MMPVHHQFSCYIIMTKYITHWMVSKFGAEYTEKVSIMAADDVVPCAARINSWRWLYMTTDFISSTRKNFDTLSFLDFEEKIHSVMITLISKLILSILQNVLSLFFWFVYTFIFTQIMTFNEMLMPFFQCALFSCPRLNALFLSSTPVHYFTLGEVLIFLSFYNYMYVHIWFNWTQTENKNGLYSIDIHIYLYSLFESALTRLGHLGHNLVLAQTHTLIIAKLHWIFRTISNID